MILKLSETLEHEFLIVDGDETGFILNRDQIFRGAILKDSALERPFGYFSSVMDYQEDSVAVFNLDAFFRDFFRYESASDLKISLVSDLSFFSDLRQFKYEDFIKESNAGISMRYIALKISGHARRKRFALSEIRVMPPGLGKRQKKMGILGCRFSRKGSVQYFLDIETIVSNALAGVFEPGLRPG